MTRNLIGRMAMSKVMDRYKKMEQALITIMQGSEVTENDDGEEYTEYDQNLWLETVARLAREALYG